MTYSRDRRDHCLLHTMAPTPIAVIFGAGPGLAASLARALAPTHALMLLSRSLPGSLPKLAGFDTGRPNTRSQIRWITSYAAGRIQGYGEEMAWCKRGSRCIQCRR
jgi:hypothetical protein